MSSWQEFATQVPDFAQRVEGLFVAYKHHTMATLRLDGSPRISGTEVTFDDGRLLLGMMPGTRRAADLRRDPRYESPHVVGFRVAGGPPPGAPPA